MTRRSIVRLTVLLATGCLLSLAGNAHAAKPEKLMRVTVEGNGHNLVPLVCLGADIVNSGGHSRLLSEVPKRITFDCLPGAAVSFEQRTEDATPGGTIMVLPEDDGKVIQLRFTQHGCYRNGVPCLLQFSKEKGDKGFAKKLEALKAAKKAGKAAGLTLSLNVAVGGAALLPVLQELKGTGAGLCLGALPDEKIQPGKVLQKLCRAIGEVEPKLLEIDSRGFAALKDRVPNVGTLMLSIGPGDGIPDLSKFARLRQLLLVVEKGKGSFDLKPLAKLTQLTALTLIVAERRCENPGAIGELANLQFLTIMGDSALDRSILGHLPNLRYLVTILPPDEDFSFVEKTPALQTLCIGYIDEQRSLKPLEKLKHLRYLALGNGNEKEFRAKSFKNVKEFQKARPDVEVVPYQGICLGSCWLILAAAAAAAAACMIRRRRGGKRLAWQR
jgi:hypothetical protein